MISDEGKRKEYVEEHSISADTEKLRKEIALIQDQERANHRATHHSVTENMSHARRELRLLEIKAEPEKLHKRGGPQ